MLRDVGMLCGAREGGAMLMTEVTFRFVICEGTTVYAPLPPYVAQYYELVMMLVLDIETFDFHCDFDFEERITAHALNLDA